MPKQIPKSSPGCKAREAQHLKNPILSFCAHLAVLQFCCTGTKLLACVSNIQADADLFVSVVASTQAFTETFGNSRVGQGTVGPYAVRKRGWGLGKLSCRVCGLLRPHAEEHIDLRPSA